MKRKIIRQMLIYIVIMSSLLVGCGKDKKESTDKGNKKKPKTQSSTEDVNDSGELIEDGDEAHEISEDAASFDFEIVYDMEKGTESAILTAYNSENKTLWTYESEEIDMTDLEGILDIGEVYNGYCFVIGGNVYKICTVGTYAGEIDWVNDEFGGLGASCYVDDSDVLNTTLYLCAYNGPALMVIDSRGNTVGRVESLDCSDMSDIVTSEELYFPYEIGMEDGQIVISFNSNESIVHVDPDTLKVTSFQFIEGMYEENRFVITGSNPFGLEDLRKSSASRDCVLAVAYIGDAGEYSGMTMEDVLNDTKETYSNVDFINGIMNYKRVEMDGGTVFIIVPIDENAEMSIYEQIFTVDGDLLRGELKYKSKPGEIVIVKGNISEIAPNIEVVMNVDGIEYSYCPELSMMDGFLVMQEGIIDFTEYGSYGYFDN